MLVIVAAVAMLLSGCGGDDNGGLSAEDMARIDSAEADAATARAEAMAAAAAQAEAEAEATAAAAAQAAAEAEAAAAMAAQMAAEAEAATAKAAQTEAEGDAADAAIAQAAAEAAQSAAEAAQAAAENAQATAEAATETANAMIAMLQQEIDDLEAAAAAGPPTTGTLEGAAGRAAAQRIEEAMVPSPLARETQDADVAADPDGVDAAGAESPNLIADDIAFPADADDVMRMGIPKDVSVADLAQARLGTPAALTLAVEGGTGLTTADDSAATDAPAIAGFDGVALEKVGPGAITQMALVYSDAERSVRAFGDVYRYNAMVSADGIPAVATSEASRTHLIISNDLAQLNVALAGTKVSLNHGLSTNIGLTTRPIVAGYDGAISGSYDGVRGQYVFAAGATLTLNPADGTLTAADTPGIVAFRANDVETLLPDTDYLAFGVWTEVPDSPTLANPGRVRAFVAGNATVFKHRHVDDLTGTASYSGGAVGHYATRAQGAHNAEMGRFTASASLDANFNGGANVLLSGMVDDFMDEDGTEMAGWLVNLNGGHMLTNIFPTDGTLEDFATGGPLPAIDTMAMDNDEIAPRPSTDGDIYGSTSGTTGSQSWSGQWDAWLFGNNLDAHPTGVAGRFVATSGMAQPHTTNDGAINLFTDEGFAGVVGSFAGR